MFAFIKKFVRYGIIAGIVVGTTAGAAVLIAGPHRTRAVVNQVQERVISGIDQCIDDPTALRAQLQEMEREYPKRIAQVRGDMAELKEQIRQLQHERAVSLRVVELADADLSEVEVRVARSASESENGMRLASVSFEERMEERRLATRVNEIKTTRVAYANRAADAEHDLKYLEQQARRLEELLLQLESERNQFKTQIASLSRQVDAIARNERLIGLLEKRNRTIEECSRYEAISLEQIGGRLAEVRSRQEAELDILSRVQDRAAYEDLARMQLATEDLEERTRVTPSEVEISIR